MSDTALLKEILTEPLEWTDEPRPLPWVWRARLVDGGPDDGYFIMVERRHSDTNEWKRIHSQEPDMQFVEALIKRTLFMSAGGKVPPQPSTSCLLSGGRKK